MKIEMGTIKSKILFDKTEEYLIPDVEKALHFKLGVRPDGYQFTPAFRRRVWDGYIDFYDKQTKEFHTGLCDKVDHILGELQNQYGFTYTFEDLRPNDAFLEPEELEDTIKLFDKNGEPNITIRDYQYNAIKSIIANKVGMVRISVGGGKTLVASGIIKELLPYLRRGERIVFFTHNSAIFSQSAKNISEQVGIEVGLYGSGKKDIKQVTFAMIPTLNASMSVDLEKGLKLNKKEMVIKRIAKEVAPKFITGSNQKVFLKNYLNLFPVKNKTDEAIKEELEELLYTTGTDAQLVMRFNSFIVKYQQLLQKKNEKAYKKKEEAQEFLDSVAVMIVDEAHHTSSDTWFNTLSSCPNAQYRVALTGSIDKKNAVLWQRMQALFEKPVADVNSSELIERGFLTKPRIMMLPVLAPTGLFEKEYATAYSQGIANNDYRNSMIATLTNKYYHEGNSILVIVKQIEHGQTISDALTKAGVDHSFIKGDTDYATRDKELQRMRDGSLRVLVATTIVDEGVDIAGINMLILGAGDKSLRQTIQRVGRALRVKEGKTEALIIDFMDYTNKHLLKHSKERIKVYESQGFDVTEVPIK